MNKILATFIVLYLTVGFIVLNINLHNSQRWPKIGGVALDILNKFYESAFTSICYLGALLVACFPIFVLYCIWR